MLLKIAEISDIEEILELHFKYQVDSIAEEDKKDGFVTTPFSKQELTDLIVKEKGLFIAKKNEAVIAYAMAASWDFWSAWPMFEYMIKGLHKLKYLGETLTTKNSFQYGPICVDKSVRGTGVLEQLFNYTKEKMAAKYPILVTFVNKNNPRSYTAHSKKLGLEVIQEFEFKNNHYYEMVCRT